MATGSVTFSGLASGLDSARLIEQLVSLERRPIDAMRNSQTALRSQSSRLGDIRTKLLAWQEVARDLSSRETASPTKAASADESVVRVKSGGDAPLGSFDVHVVSLAKAHRSYTNAFASATTAGVAGAGSFTVQIGTQPPAVIAIEATDTLADVASKINDAGAGVTATLVYSGTAYRLQIAGTATGADNAVTFSETGTTLGLADAPNQVVAASDAEITLDGFTITNSTNTLTEAIAGVTLELRGTSGVGESTAVTIEDDPDALATVLETFVSTYNQLTTAIGKEFQGTPGLARTDSLAGDGALRALQSSIRSAVTSTVATGGAYETLASIGVSVTRDGSLTLDKEKLGAAFAADRGAVRDLLAGTTSVDGIMTAIDEGLERFSAAGDGVLATRMDGISDRVRDLDDRAEAFERRIDAYETSLRMRFAALEQLVSGLQAQGAQVTSILTQLSS